MPWIWTYPFEKNPVMLFPTLCFIYPALIHKRYLIIRMCSAADLLTVDLQEKRRWVITLVLYFLKSCRIDLIAPSPLIVAGAYVIWKNKMTDYVVLKMNLLKTLEKHIYINHTI